MIDFAAPIRHRFIRSVPTLHKDEVTWRYLLAHLVAFILDRPLVPIPKPVCRGVVLDVYTE